LKKWSTSKKSTCQILKPEPFEHHFMVGLTFGMLTLGKLTFWRLAIHPGIKALRQMAQITD
jgi:hypothetical protein